MQQLRGARPPRRVRRAAAGRELRHAKPGRRSARSAWPRCSSSIPTGRHRPARSTAKRPTPAAASRARASGRSWSTCARLRARVRGAVRARRRDRDARRRGAALAGARALPDASSTARRSARAATPSTPAGSTPPACRGWPCRRAPSREGLPIGLQLIGPYGQRRPAARPGRRLRGGRALGRPLARTLRPDRKHHESHRRRRAGPGARAPQTGRRTPPPPCRCPTPPPPMRCRPASRRRSAGSTTRAPRHWKSGGPSRDAVLTHAPLPPAGVWASPADARATGRSTSAASRPRSRCVWAATSMPRLPPRSMSPPPRALIDAMCVSIELVDSRWTEGLDAPRAGQAGRPAVARRAGARRLGAVRGPRLGSADLPRARSATQPPRSTAARHSMGDPAFVLPAWLRHATRDGGVAARPARSSPPAPGAACPLAAAGDRVVAEFPGIGQAAVQL